MKSRAWKRWALRALYLAILGLTIGAGGYLAARLSRIIWVRWDQLAGSEVAAAWVSGIGALLAAMAAVAIAVGQTAYQHTEARRRDRITARLLAGQLHVNFYMLHLRADLAARTAESSLNNEIDRAALFGRDGARKAEMILPVPQYIIDSIPIMGCFGEVLGRRISTYLAAVVAYNTTMQMGSIDFDIPGMKRSCRLLKNMAFDANTLFEALKDVEAGGGIPKSLPSATAH